MATPEDRLAAQMPLIQRALEQALTDAAGEPMGYVLLCVPFNRVGDHIAVSNIAEKRTIVKFLREAARTMKADWMSAERLMEKMARRGMN